METMQNKGKVRVAKQAIRLFYLLLSLALGSCSLNKTQKSLNDSLEVKKYTKKSERHYASVSITFYDYEEKKNQIPGMYHVNGIAFPPQSKTEVASLILTKDQVYNFRFGSFGKAWVDFKTELSLGDSTIIKVYLKDSEEVLY